MDDPVLTKMHVFLDANVFLSFYAYPKSDLTQLSKFPALINSGTLKLYVTEQVIDEIERNRGAKIAECIATFRETKLSARVPLVLDSFAEAKAYKEACRIAEVNRDKLIQSFQDLAQKRDLIADSVIEKIIEKSTIIKSTDSLYLAAVKRHRIGNPPGKKDSLGDQLNWEALLKDVPDKTDLSIVSSDADFRSRLDKTEVNEFLAKEWACKKNGAHLRLYDEIGDFLRSVNSTIEISTEKTKDEKLHTLIDSLSFANTHSAVAALENFIPFLSENDLKLLASASIENNQINWIHTDEDVCKFFQRVFKGRMDKLGEIERQKIRQMFFGSELVEEIEVPF